MKKLLLIFALAITFTSNAQISAGTMTSTNDTLVVVPYAILIQPILINALTKDTAYQVMWNVQNISRDTAQGSPCNVTFYNRQGNGIYNAYCFIPKEVIKNWGTSDEIIDLYILGYFKLTPINYSKK